MWGFLTLKILPIMALALIKIMEDLHRKQDKQPMTSNDDQQILLNQSEA